MGDSDNKSDTDSDGSLLEEVIHDDDNEDIDNMRSEIEQSLNMNDADKSVLKFLENCDEFQNKEYSEEILKSSTFDTIDPPKYNMEKEVLDNEEKDEEEEKDIVCNLTEISCKFPVKDMMETRSITSSTSTIHPDIVKARVRQSLEKKQKNNQPRRTIAKGEASAKTRAR